MAEFDKDKVVAVLNQILEMELAGVVRYTHYSFLVFGFGRIPIVAWLRDQANESLIHAQQVGEWITHLGAYPSLQIGPLLDSQKFDIGDVLRESLQAEGAALALYRNLLDLARDSSVPLEEFARQMISLEEMHAGEVDKMLRKPGQLAAFALAPALVNPRSATGYEEGVMITDHELVILIEDIPAENLKAGDVGTAVHTHQGKGSFDVEFFSPDGEATRIVTVPAGHLALHEEPRRDSDPPPHGIGARGSVALTQNLKD